MTNDRTNTGDSSLPVPTQSQLAYTTLQLIHDVALPAKDIYHLYTLSTVAPEIFRRLGEAATECIPLEEQLEVFMSVLSDGTPAPVSSERA